MSLEDNFLRLDPYNFNTQEEFNSFYYGGNMQDLIGKQVTIKPLEDLKGILLGIVISKMGIEYQVRYFLNGTAYSEYFFDWEIEVNSDK